MEEKEHLRIKTSNNLSEVGEIKFNYGAPPSSGDDKEKTPYYGKMAEQFKFYLNKYRTDVERKKERQEIDVASNIDYILINFQSHFVIDQFYQYWYSTFGLEAVRFTKFNIEVLFAIIQTFHRKC